MDLEQSWQSSEVQGCNIEFYTLQSSVLDYKPTTKSHRSKNIKIAVLKVYWTQEKLVPKVWFLLYLTVDW